MKEVINLCGAYLNGLLYSLCPIINEKLNIVKDLFKRKKDDGINYFLQN